MITLEQARELAPQAVEKMGRDFRYTVRGVSTDCFYEPTEVNSLNMPLPADDVRRTTGCLVGGILDLAGEQRQRGRMQGVMSLLESFPDMFTREAAVYLTRLQQSQDGGETWGEAHDSGEQWYREEWPKVREYWAKWAKV